MFRKRILPVLILVSLLVLMTLLLSGLALADDGAPPLLPALGGILTAEKIAGIAGVALSLAFSFIPGISTWYSGIAADWKRTIMGVLLVLVTGAVFGLGCADIVDSGLACDRIGAIDAAWALLVALMANQATFLITPKGNR